VLVSLIFLPGFEEGVALYRTRMAKKERRKMAIIDTKIAVYLQNSYQMGGIYHVAQLSALVAVNFQFSMLIHVHDVDALLHFILLNHD
jgi:hypothetical protein